MIAGSGNLVPGPNGAGSTNAETPPVGNDPTHSGTGGIGASGTSLAADGESASSSGGAGGGGGGGAGRIRINDGSSGLTCQSPAPFFPKVLNVTSCGSVGLGTNGDP